MRATVYRGVRRDVAGRRSGCGLFVHGSDALLLAYSGGPRNPGRNRLGFRRRGAVGATDRRLVIETVAIIPAIPRFLLCRFYSKKFRLPGFGPSLPDCTAADASLLKVFTVTYMMDSISASSATCDCGKPLMR